MNDNIERELKLVPLEPELLNRLASVERLGTFRVRGKRHELQRNSFFDTPTRSLGSARIGFRRRTVSGRRQAVWTLKADGELVGGLATRSEIELELDRDLPPGLAIGALADTARSRGAVPLAEEVHDALSAGGLPLATPMLETETDRTILDLEEPEHGWAVELALDRMRLIGHDYADLEIEAELKFGDTQALDVVRQAIEAIGEVRESRQSKLSRALAHLKS